MYDLRHFNGRDIKYKEFLSEFRNAVQEYMVEDRGRHETQYNGTIISKVSFGFSMKQMFKTVCEKVKEKNPIFEIINWDRCVFRVRCIILSFDLWLCG